MNWKSPAPSAGALSCPTRTGRPRPPRRLLWWAMILAASGVLSACDRGRPERACEPAAPPKDQADVARLERFVDLLHREIDQLQKDRERQKEEVERLQRENAALRALTGK
jgi:hypothetical protein